MQLAAILLSHDEEFRRQAAQLLQGGGVPVGILDPRRIAPESSAGPDLALIDLRHDSAAGLNHIERLRAAHPTLAIFAVASVADPDLILQAMRAGANEFFTWPGADASPQTVLSFDESFHGAVRRAASRREATHAGTRPPSVSLVFFGAKGGAGTTTLSVNCAVELARLTKRPAVIVDLKASLGEVALFLGVRPRFTVLDGIENLHRLDRDFLKELVAKHKSGLDILGGSEQFDRPGAQDAGAIEELLRVLAKVYDFVVVDAGNFVNSCALAAFHAADTIFLVTNPDVPSIRNAQRMVDRVRQLGAGSERVRVVLNRFAEHLMIGPKQIETALGYPIHQVFTSDYRTVSTALNSGVPLALTNHSDISSQFDAFTRQIISPSPVTPEPERKRRFLGLR
ncbi:MAG: AAA family ATPase [Acidobacteria bacterium]|nr:AAA family ATPase [Acidobacteriota bacterium]